MNKIPILTYHANNIDGTTYQTNDHVALAEDLALIQELGLNIISMDQLMDWYLGQSTDQAIEKAVVLTCDDGTWFDYHDLEHPTYGHQTSFFNLLLNHQEQTGQSVHMTNFVIVSPEARKILDEKCLIGKGWWQHDWWLEAQQSGIMGIENHSWDHNHGVLDNNNIDDDTFRCIKTKEACDIQIEQAQRHLFEILNKQHQPTYFAYPYGNFSDYLRYEYLPLFGRKIKLKAAFTTEPKHVDKFCKPWAIPRYVCNNDWRNTDQLKDILLAIGR